MKLNRSDEILQNWEKDLSTTIPITPDKQTYAKVNPEAVELTYDSDGCMYGSVDFRVDKIMAVEAVQSETQTMLEELKKEIQKEVKKEFVKGEQEKMGNLDDYLVLQVRFPNSNTNYEYLIDKAFLQSKMYYDWSKNINKEYFIVNEFGYAYSSPIRIVKKPYPYTSSSEATKKILCICERYGNLYHTDHILCWEKSAESLDIAYLNLENAKKAYNKINDTDNMYEIFMDESTMSRMGKNPIKKSNNKGEDTMNIFGNFDFGQVKNTQEFKMTLKGIAYLSTNGATEKTSERTYVQYDPTTSQIEDVTPFIISDMDATEFLFKIPVALKDVKAGDIIYDNGVPVFVRKVDKNELEVVSPRSKTVRTILPAKNAFGFNFVTKLVNLMDNFNVMGGANAENPFGNILPLMLLTGNSSSSSLKDMLPFMLMGGGAVDMSNPMMMYFLLKDGSGDNLLPLVMMSNPNMFNFMNNKVTDTQEDA